MRGSFSIVPSSKRNGKAVVVNPLTEAANDPLGMLSMNSLAAADHLLIALQCEYMALEGLGQILKVVDRLKQAGVNPSLDVGGIIMTMFDSRINLAKQVVEEVRHDYCRMRLAFSPELEQAAGVVHGGAIATALDHVVVPAVGSAYTAEHRFSTVDMHVQYLSALIQEDGIAEGWVVKRGRTTVFCEAELVGASSGKLIARSVLTYNVSTPRH